SCGRFYKPTDTPDGEPTGDKFEIDYSPDSVYNIKKNPSDSDYEGNPKLANLNREFNQRYTMMLMQIQEAFNGSPKTLYTAIMNGMHGLMPVAREMVQTRIDDSSLVFGCPTFQWEIPFS